MRALVLLLTPMTMVGCNMRTVPRGAPNCAVQPADFHDVRTDGWPGGGRDIEPPPQDTIALSGRTGEPRWNGVPLGGLIDMSPWTVLDTYLAQTARLVPTPNVTLVFERGTSCAAVERARALMRRYLQCDRSDKCYQGSLDRYVG